MTGDDALMASVIDELPLGVWIARAPGGELVFANRTFREIMGMDARGDVAVGAYAAPYGICDRDGRPYPEAGMPFVRALAARATVTVDDIVIHRHDGRKVDIRATARPIFDGDRITHVVIAFADATAEVAADAARRDSEARLRQAQRLESLGTLAAGVAHDFNNLLGSISLIASMLRARERDPMRLEDLRRIEQITESASRLSRSLLAFGRQTALRAVRFDVGDVAGTVVELARRTFDRKIEIGFERAPRAIVHGDPSALEQLFMNLLVNARDAMPDGGALLVRVTREGGAVVIEVEDRGPGVPAELRGRVFEPYFTTKATGDTPGRGLGLSTVYGVVESHAGTIAIGDASPHGAIFRITLPSAPGEAASSVAATGSSPEIITFRGRGRALVVDDEPVVRSAVRRALRELGYEVIEAGDGAAGLAALDDAAPFAVVLLDSVMPKASGADVLAELRRRAPETRVLLMGGRITPAEHEALIAAGAAAILHKPFDVAALAAVLAEVAAPAPEDRE